MLFVTILAWVIAEAIPVFSELLSIISSLFVSGLSFYLPPVIWYVLLREGAWYEKHNLKTAMYNLVVFIVGMIVFGCGTYASIAELVSSLFFYFSCLWDANVNFGRFISSSQIPLASHSRVLLEPEQRMLFALSFILVIKGWVMRIGGIP